MASDTVAAAALSLHIASSSSPDSAVSRVASALQLSRLSAVALLIAGLWAALQQAAHALLLRVISALSRHAAAARRCRQQLLPPSGGSGTAPAPPTAPQQRQQEPSRLPCAGAAPSHHAQQQQHKQRAPAAPLSWGGIGAARIPAQMPHHRGRLTIALDLDETLLATIRLQACPGSADDLVALQPGPVGGSSSSRLASLLSCGRASSSGSVCGGSYVVSRHSSDELGAAAGASAYMHFVPAASSSGGGSSLARPQRHTLAVFERPGCREFLGRLATFAEVVLFTAASPAYGAPLADLLDPQANLFAARLYGDACVSVAGRRNVKDLQVLGRDASRLVLVDNCLTSFLAQPRNGVPCLPFHGPASGQPAAAAADSQLLGVILPLLSSLAQVQGDIRPLLDSMFNVSAWLASKGYAVPQQH